LSIISGDEETEDGIAQSGGTQGNSGVTNNIDSNKRLIDSNLSDREIEEENYDWLMDERRSLFEGVDFNNLSKSDKIMIDMMGKALKVT
jgi:23S rRNA maturation-related 3'-5' exoribonuclease YhaM